MYSRLSGRRQHVDAPQSLRRAHVHDPVPDHQIAALHQLCADLVGQEHVLVERRVGHPGGQQGEGRFARAGGGGQLAERLAQQASVMLDLPHPALPVETPHARLHRLAVGDHVGHPRRHPQVVFEHQEPVVGAHDVGAADGDPGPVGRAHPAHLAAVLGTAVHQVLGDDPVGDGPGVAVDVCEKVVEGEDPLHEARLEPLPVGGGHDAGNAVDRDDPLVRLLVAVDREGDALVEKRPADPLLNLAELCARQPAQRLVELEAVLAWRAVRPEHLVVDGRVDLVRAEIHAVLRQSRQTISSCSVFSSIVVPSLFGQY